MMRQKMKNYPTRLLLVESIMNYALLIATYFEKFIINCLRPAKC